MAQIFNPLLKKRFQLNSTQSTIHDSSGNTLAGVIGEAETILVSNTIPKGLPYTITLQNSIADKQVSVVSGVGISIDNLNTTMVGSNQIVITPPFDINIGEEIQVLYHKALSTVSSGTISLGSGGITAAVSSDGNIVANYDIINVGSTPQYIQLGMNVTDGGTNTQSRTASYLVPLGESTYTATFTGLNPATYTFNATSGLLGSVSPLVIPTPTASFAYTNFKTVLNGTDVTTLADVTNIGSLAGSTSVYFQKGTESKKQVVTPTINTNSSTTVSYTYQGLTTGTYAFKAFKSDSTTQIDLTNTVVLSPTMPSQLRVSSVATVDVAQDVYAPYAKVVYVYGSWSGTIVNGSAYPSTSVSRCKLTFDVTGITTATGAYIDIPNTTQPSSLNCLGYLSNAIDNTFNEVYSHWDSLQQWIGSVENTVVGSMVVKRLHLNSAGLTYLNSHSSLPILLKATTENAEKEVIYYGGVITLNLTY